MPEYRDCLTCLARSACQIMAQFEVISNQGRDMACMYAVCKPQYGNQGVGNPGTRIEQTYRDNCCKQRRR